VLPVNVKWGLIFLKIGRMNCGFTAVTIKIAAFWDVMPYSMINVDMHVVKDH
jgi:hypothetical protein